MRKILGALVFLALLSPIFAYAQSATCVTFSGDLTFGDTGSEVTKLQTFLKAQGYLTAPLVPNFGNATLAAVRAFQSAQGISATGTVGPLTRAAIQRVSCGGSSSGSGASSQAASHTNTTTNSFEVTGWIPYWRGATGTADVMPHLDELTEINPFVYSVNMFRITSAVHRRSIKMDAVGLALFTVAGVGIALSRDAPLVVAVLMGVIAGTTGGLLRDVVVNELPDLFRPGGLYASASFCGGVAFVVALRLDAGYANATIIGATTVVLLRLVSIRLGVSIPVPQWIEQDGRSQR